jgi:hypothetical protein
VKSEILEKSPMPALVSIQCNPVMMAFYNCLKGKGKNRKVIVCAITRKLVHNIFGILKSGKKFDSRTDIQESKITGEILSC